MDNVMHKPVKPVKDVARRDLLMMRLAAENENG